MKILILVNGAQEHRPFYAGVGRDLERRGHEVHYALDSHYTDVLHPETPLRANAHYFSDYFRANFARREPPKELANANLNLMMFPDADRFTYTHSRARARRTPDYCQSLMANLGHFFVELFDRFSFDSVVYENVSNAMSYVACEVARARGARYIGFAASRMPGRLDVLDQPWARDSQLEPTFQQIRSGALEVPAEVRAWVRDYIDNFDRKVPDYVAHPHPFAAGLLDRYLQKRPIMRMLRSMQYDLTHREDARYGYQVGSPFVAYPEQFVREVYRHIKVRLLNRDGYETELDLSRPYFAYPLQFHPESSASVDGASFNDEWHNIEGILQNLPHGYCLYVKDHKHAAGRQSLDFYSRLRRLPNVVLVSPNYDAKQLMRHAKAVVCSTSTMGFEALVLGTPVFVLGHPFYEFFPSCVRIPSFDGAHAIFRRHEELKSKRSEIEDLIAAYYLTSEEGRLDLLQMYEDPNVMRWIAEVVERRTAEHRTRRSESQRTVSALSA